MPREIKNTNFENIDKSQIDKFMSRNQQFRALMLQYQCALMEIETKVKILNAEFSLHNDRNPIESIKTRIKEPDSIVKKIRTKNLPLNLKSIQNNILDIAGVRIVCSFEEDVYYLRDCLANQDDIEVLIEKDYIKTPKPNGYRSLHLTVTVPVFFAEDVVSVPVEIQFRTIAMDFWASLEYKIRYKKNVDDSLIAAELLACAHSSREWDTKMAYLMHLIESQDQTNDQSE
ncbi:MAG: GTP pyrophosphokinase [Fastidiosipilaceae bacterium]|nr:GTP pyrophosphokinase family protein [Clostridiaceae bacterium]